MEKLKVIPVKGTIVSNDEKWIYDWFEIEAVCPKDVAQALKDSGGEDITVEISSGGGDVIAGNEIYYHLNTYKGNVTNDIMYAGSAASVVAMSGKARIVPSGLFMIHNVSGGANGDYHSMDQASEMLKVANNAISNSYRIKTGMSQKDLLSLMDKESWMDAEKALQYKFIDEIINDPSGIIKNSQPQKIYNAGFTNVLNKEVIEKVRNTIKSPNGEAFINSTDSDILMLKNRLNLLKLRGERRYEI